MRLAAFGVLALLAVGLAAQAADPVNCDPERGMVDLDRCPQGKPPYDPFADKKLTCWEMKRYPDLIFNDNADLGHPLAIEIDWYCRENLTRLPFLKRLGELTEIVRSDRAPQSCTGTIVRGQWHSYSLALLEAGVAPARLLRNERYRQQLDPERTDSAVREYFQRWSYEGLYNFDLHRDYMAELVKATPRLTSHYQRMFKFSKADARPRHRAPSQGISG